LAVAKEQERRHAQHPEASRNIWVIVDVDFDDGNVGPEITRERIDVRGENTAGRAPIGSEVDECETPTVFDDVSESLGVEKRNGGL
jgi:hypothetical protein